MSQELIADSWAAIIGTLGYDRNDPHLQDTPRRVARFMSEWHTANTKPPELTVFPNGGYDAVVAVGGISFYSMCAHHGLPFFGTAAVGYIPDQSVVGLSKIARVVDHFSRRFQVQEGLTNDVASYLEMVLRPRGVGVVMRAEHLCMSMRGINKPGHATVTSDIRGAFRDEPAARAELLSLIDGGKK